MKITARDRLKESFGVSVPLTIREEAPASLEQLLARDEEFRNLWNGHGRPIGSDTSRSGYDFSAMHRLISLDERNFDNLATMLAVRPEGAVMNSGKGEGYIRRTIANAIGKALVK